MNSLLVSILLLAPNGTISLLHKKDHRQQTKKKEQNPKHGATQSGRLGMLTDAINTANTTRVRQPHSITLFPAFRFAIRQNANA
jgi:hypothetical protein